jgi:hypothetical protein
MTYHRRQPSPSDWAITPELLARTNRLSSGARVTKNSIGGIPRVRGTLEQRFWSKVYMDPNCGCWLWAGDGSKRYGTIGIRIDNRQKRIYAHRLSYEMHIGPIPEGKEIDHTCRVTFCVNPRHLEPVTTLENHRRMPSESRHRPYRTHCANGHEFTPENTRRIERKKYPYKVCIICSRAAFRRHDLKRRPRIKAPQ